MDRKNFFISRICILFFAIIGFLGACKHDKADGKPCTKACPRETRSVSPLRRKSSSLSPVVSPRGFDSTVVPVLHHASTVPLSSSAPTDRSGAELMGDYFEARRGTSGHTKSGLGGSSSEGGVDLKEQVLELRRSLARQEALAAQQAEKFDGLYALIHGFVSKGASGSKGSVGSSRTSFSSVSDSEAGEFVYPLREKDKKVFTFSGEGLLRPPSPEGRRRTSGAVPVSPFLQKDLVEDSHSVAAPVLAPDPTVFFELVEDVKTCYRAYCNDDLFLCVGLQGDSVETKTRADGTVMSQVPIALHMMCSVNPRNSAAGEDVYWRSVQRSIREQANRINEAFEFLAAHLFIINVGSSGYDRANKGKDTTTLNWPHCHFIYTSLFLGGTIPVTGMRLRALCLDEAKLLINSINFNALCEEFIDTVLANPGYRVHEVWNLLKLHSSDFASSVREWRTRLSVYLKFEESKDLNALYALFPARSTWKVDPKLGLTVVGDAD